MTRGRQLTVLLGILGLGDLAMVPFMIAAHQHAPGQPPLPAIAAVGIIGIATLASARPAVQGSRRAFRVALTCRVLDSISSILGLAVRPSGALIGLSAWTLALSVAAVILLVRLSPRKTPRTADAAVAGQQ